MIKPKDLLICFYILGSLTGSSLGMAQDGGLKLSTGLEVNVFTLEYEDSCFAFTGQLASLELTEVRDPEPYVRLSFPGYFHGGNPGGPALPQKSILFEAAEQDLSAIRILSCDSVVFDLEEMGIMQKLLPF